MTNTIKSFIEANPTDKRVVRILKAANRPLSLNGNLGRLIGELQRDLELAA